MAQHAGRGSMLLPTIVRSATLPVLGVLVFFAAWQGLASGPLRNSNLPYASGTITRFVEILGTSTFWTQVGTSLVQAIVGLAISVAVGLPLGLFVGTSSLGLALTRVVIDVIRPIPSVVVLPLAVLQWGSSTSMAIFLVCFTLIPLLIGTVAAGVRDADPIMLDAARSYRLGPLARTWRVVIPSALPFIATGLRISTSFALVIAMVAGIIGGAPGLGHELEVYRQAGLLETVFAYVIALGSLGIVLNLVLTWMERRVVHWHESVRNTTSRLPAVRADRSPRETTEHARRWAIQDAADSILRRAVDFSHIRRIENVLRPLRTPVSDQVKRWGQRITTVAVPVALVLLWWFMSRHSTDPYYPALSDILLQFSNNWLSSGFTENVWPSLRNLVSGVGLGILLGVSAGVLIGQVDWLYRMVNPLISFFRSIPGIAYLPVLIAVVGFSSGMRVTAIALATVFPLLLATIDGLRSVDSTMIDVTRSFHVSRWRRLISVQLPSAGPRIFAGLDLGLAAAVVVMVASELMGTSQGIGAKVLLAQQYFQFADVWAGVLLLALIGIATNLVFRIARRVLLAWYDGIRAANRTA
ncbi:ABC transporter permease subunit [Prescottella equi]|uniref:ABC transporter permease subunit n=1 Tax=Rhodococcus hoagii TaxID=43767 RepID=UPI00111C7DDE